MAASPAAEIIRILKNILPPQERTALHEPSFLGNEWNYVKECLDSGWVSSAGKYVDRFEGMVADFTGSPFAVATVNGTSALHVCLLLAGVRPGDEVIVPGLTFVATANAVKYCGAEPHFADIEEQTLGLDPEGLDRHLARLSARDAQGNCVNRETGRIIRGVVAVHTFGHPVDLDPLAEVCRKYALALIEDAAESLGTTYKGRHTGRFGRLAALSFNGNKIITTGGGGAILTADPELGRAAKHLTTTARLPHQWNFIHDRIGFNYRLPNLNAALGCAQLEQLPGFVERKRELARRYQEAFRALAGVAFVAEPPFARSNYWLNTLILADHSGRELDHLLQMAHGAGLELRPAWTPLPTLPIYAGSPRADLARVNDLARRIVNIPSSPSLL